MAIALLGGTGFIGSRVTRRLAEAGVDVITVQRGRTSGPGLGVRALAADRGDVAGLRTALEAASPAVLVDMVAYTAADAERLLAALPTSVERLIVISSGDVYWTYGGFLGLDRVGPPAGPLDESAPLRETRYPCRARAKGPADPLHDYEKIDVERIARERAGVPVTILRLPMVYGPDDPRRRVAGCLERLEASRGVLRLDAAEAAWRCTRGYVEDVAAAIALVALDRRAAGRIYNVGEADAATELQWTRAVAAAAGWRGVVVGDADAGPTLPARWEIPLVTDTRRIRAELGFREPVGRVDGLTRTVGEAPRRT